MRKLSFFTPCVAALASLLVLQTVAYAQQKTVKACEAEWRANKATIQASGKKKTEFMTECRAGTGQTAKAAPAAPANPPAAATNAPVTTETKPAPSTAATAKAEERPAARRFRRLGTAAPAGAGQYTTEAEAKSHCPGETVVWANTMSHIYHFPGSRNYGSTKTGAYMCEKDTAAAGIRSAKNEKRR